LVELRQPEVGQFRVAGLGDQDVLGLDVTMQDTGLVRGGKTICGPRKDAGELIGRETR
jgi:hypothetical protein